MKISRRFVRAGVLLAALAVGVGTTVGCSTTTPEAMCAFVVGDGQAGNDAKLHRVVQPGESIGESTGEIVRFVPCNSRNYKINDGTVVNANKEQVGDRFVPTLAYTRDGTPISIWTDSYWTLNQNEAILEKFYELCYKYSCYSESREGGAANYSTPGWNGMLGENFGPNIDDIAIEAASLISDDIWRNQDAGLRDELGDKMSALFAANMREKFGYAEDFFCGSGNSGFNPDGTYNCTQVRVDVVRVDRYVPTTEEAASNPDAQARLNAERLRVAEALYGPSAGYWLGVQDSINACRNAQTPCQIMIGQVPVPTG